MRKALQTTLLLAAISGLFLAVGYLFGGSTGLLISLFLSIAMNVGSYWFSDKVVLAMHQAKELDRTSDLAIRVQHLARRAKLPMPRVYMYDSAQPNAFATGRNPEHGVVAVSTGLLEHLSEAEVDGVLAHELAHIQNRDMLVSSIAATFAAAISYLGNIFLFLPGSSDEEGQNPAYSLFALIATPIIAAILQMAVSRTREYLADETGAQIAGSPDGLASALERIEAVYSRNPSEQQNLNTAAASHLYIANPLKGSGIANLFSTHPPTEERVRRLRARVRV